MKLRSVSPIVVPPPAILAVKLSATKPPVESNVVLSNIVIATKTFPVGGFILLEPSFVNTLPSCPN